MLPIFVALSLWLHVTVGACVDAPYEVSVVPTNTSGIDVGPNLVGEGPHWDEEAQVLYWVDTTGQNIFYLDYATDNVFVKHIEYGQVNLVIPVVGSKRLLVSVRAELYILDLSKPGDEGLRLLAPVDLGRPDNVINDGKADAIGRFWGGTKGSQNGDDVNPDEAAFYSLSQERFTEPRVQLKPVTISNGVVWSLNNTVMYYIDSPTYRVDAFDFDLEKGEISNRRAIIDIRDYGYSGIPDGMTIDKEGHLWVAVMFNGTVLQVDPDARSVVARYSLPVSRTTSCAWGGADLDLLYVTTASQNMSPQELEAEPLAGSLLVVKGLGSRGVPLHKFKFDAADAY